MTAIETLIEMTEVSQLAFYRRLAKGDSLLFLRALHLAQKAGTTQAAIRKELGLTQPVASRFAARLKKLEWLESEPSISDRRENAVRTTKKGKELLAKLETELVAILRQYAAGQRVRPSRKLKTKSPRQGPGRMIWDPITSAGGTESSNTPATEAQRPGNGRTAGDE
jgi:DNA-binding MarR family transcriptional regulator